MRFFRKPAPITVMFVDGPRAVDFDDVFKALIGSQEVVQAWDRRTRKAARKTVLGKSVGDVLRLEDAPWEALLPVVRHPRMLVPAVLDADADAGDPMLGAIENATTTEPKSAAAEAVEVSDSASPDPRYKTGEAAKRVSPSQHERQPDTHRARPNSQRA
jgi:hypothetical protein